MPSSLDYSDENANVSGAENEEHNDRRKDNNEISTSSHEDHNEESTTMTVSTTTSTMPKILPCDEDNGGCDQNCQMVVDEHDTESRIQCSCSHGFTLDEVDGRRCHGMMRNLIFFGLQGMKTFFKQFKKMSISLLY